MIDLSIYRNHDAMGLADLVRRGECQPADLVEAALLAIEQLNPKLNAVVRVLADAARVQAASPLPDGPFRGVPLLLKDTGVSLAGTPTEYGSRYFTNFTKPYDSELVRRYKQAGFVIIGKTNAAELGTSCSCETVATGPMHNPWDLGRIPGVSSGGSAAAVAAGIVPAAHATDAGGSIRGPAAWCGLVGLKPTRGRISYGPDAWEHWSGLATQHVVTRSVRDTAAILDCTAGHAPGDPYSAPLAGRPFLENVSTSPGVLRIGFSADVPQGSAADEIRCAVLSTVGQLRQLGHHVEAVSPRWDTSLVGEIMGCVAACALTEAITQREQETGMAPTRKLLEHANWTLLQRGLSLTAMDLMSALKKANEVGRSFAEFFSDFDVWLTPTMSSVAPAHGYLDSSSPDVGRLLDRFSKLYACNSIYNISGLPAITLPLHMSSERLPIGIMLGAGFGRENILFQIAGELERESNWIDRHPPHSVWH